MVVAENGEAALRHVEERLPDVALLDVGMPDLTGHEVGRRIRAHPQGTAVLLVAVTGWGQEKDRLESAAAGFDHHLTKPVDPEVVLQLIARIHPPPALARIASRSAD